MPDGTARPYAVASPHHAATEAGAAAFAAGGNAVDAALAAACMLTVVYPHMCALGGDVMAVVHDGDAHAVNGSGRAPGALPPAGRGPPPAERGPLTITVPGAVSAWQTMAERWGALPLSFALEVAAEVAEHGVPVAPSLARSLEEERRLVTADPGLAGVLAPAGRPLEEGESLVQERLAATLRRLAGEGVEDLYHGEIAAGLADGMAAVGCPLDAADLAAHRTDLEPALGACIGGEQVLTMGANSQGFSLLQILAAVEALEIDDPLGAGAPLLAAVFRESADDRDRHLADPQAMDRPVESLLTAEHIAALAGRARTRTIPRPAAVRPGGDTVAVVAADDRLAVSLIESLFYGFGSGILEPRTGIILHNRGACFSADPASPNARGPGKRPLHTLMPLLVAGDGGVAWTAGTMGGRAQAQIHAQLLLRRRAGDSAAVAVAAPRFVVGDLEAGGADTAVEEDDQPALKAFAAAGVATAPVPRWSEETGHAHAIARLADGGFEAAADPRSDGAAAAS
jgi:gamma-glutamyltranspeptidase